MSSGRLDAGHLGDLHHASLDGCGTHPLWMLPGFIRDRVRWIKPELHTPPASGARVDSWAAIAVGPGAFVRSTGAGIDFGTYVGGDVGIGARRHRGRRQLSGSRNRGGPSRPTDGQRKAAGPSGFVGGGLYGIGSGGKPVLYPGVSVLGALTPEGLARSSRRGVQLAKPMPASAGNSCTAALNSSCCASPRAGGTARKSRLQTRLHRRRRPTGQWYGGPFPEPPPWPSILGLRATEHTTSPAPGAWAPESSAGANPLHPSATVGETRLSPSRPSPTPP